MTNIAEYVDPQIKWSNEFDKLLISVIDETIKYVMGDLNAYTIFKHIEENYCCKEEIPERLKFFSSALRDLIGTGRGQMLGAASILEETIAESLALKIGKQFKVEPPINFPEYIGNIKKTYIFEKRLR